jgi:hypothetical protein
MLRLLVTCTSLALAGCGAPPVTASGFGSSPLAVLASQSGALSVELRSSPQPPQRGSIEVQLKVMRDGAPLDDVTVEVTPWMDQMGHGTSVTPTVVPQGDGVYVVKDVYLYMAGHWTLRTQFSGALEDSLAPAFDIP